MNNDNFVKFEQLINYEFKKKELINEALTHSSYANEKKNKKYKHNERLEFLGDSVLGLIISDYLFINYPDLPEGELTKTRAKIVCEPTLSYCAKAIDLGNYIMLGKGEDATGGRERQSLLADAFESVIGAIYLDGGIESAKKFILWTMKEVINDALNGKIFIDYKTRLQELIQNDPNVKISYEIIDEKGPDHNKTFYTQVKKNDNVLGHGKGKSKKESEQNAAKMALGVIKNG
ncbi:ribonuclease III [Paramaledivibacter caminithermalis]|uniref:Ribonuclease 3 n=1 Tax=Paramaledivibacter caminithermalis (strain DSM 15212 / CIP 107654 / DViRD3) TaxID=1121301 RepID=A0A1M6NJ68_PARC5|nr:ribonuclease III [Paramaledivibacter caminithermalis]SHJ95785.1 ribonuclease-3 [Paramaledivibacter caminithermalis DSM 15212]